MGFVDTHIHLHFPEYESDLGEVMIRAREAGVDTFLNVGTDVESSRRSLELADAHSNIFASAGLHPHDAKNGNPEAYAEFEKLLTHPRMVAVGEVGLDFFRDHSPQDKQREVLREFIRMARRLNKPLIVHCRDAYEALVSLLEEEGGAPYQGVIHCFSSDVFWMRKLVELGFYISFAGPLTYKKNDTLREACAACPVDRILLETDAPFLPPQSIRGKRNEPCYLMETARVAAEVQGVSLDSMEVRTTLNARRLFRL